MILDDLSYLTRSVGAAAEEWFNPSVRLGVTGLSRSGKTVFITALVHNLIRGGRLPFFAPLAEGRILRAYLEPQPDDSVPRFAYEDHIACLTGQTPHWPESTRHISQLRLTLEYEPAAFLRRQLGSATVHIDIVDYPGEWLLDLPLLQQTYEEWSAEALALSRAPERLGLASDWHAFLSGLEPSAPADEQAAITGARLFTRYLRACRGDASLLSTLTPGRMLMPGDMEGSPALTFMPLDVSGGGGRGLYGRDSMHAMMSRRFEAYKTHVVKPFFRDHFARLERQIVLVDALSAMNAGPLAFADLERALTTTLGCFRAGANNWLTAIMGKRIDRILFAATKADHIHHTSHDRLEAIMRAVLDRAISRAEFSGAEVRSQALAAVRSTREVEAAGGADGALGCIAGRPLAGELLDGQTFDGSQEVALFPGDLPASPGTVWRGYGSEDDKPTEKKGQGASGDSVRFLRFAPPVPQASQVRGFGASAPLPHIRLDRAIQFLIGDKFV